MKKCDHVIKKRKQEAEITGNEMASLCDQEDNDALDAAGR